MPGVAKAKGDATALLMAGADEVALCPQASLSYSNHQCHPAPNPPAAVYLDGAMPRLQRGAGGRTTLKELQPNGAAVWLAAVLQGVNRCGQATANVSAPATERHYSMCQR